MSNKTFEHLLGAVIQMRRDEEEVAPDVIKVSDTISKAATAYENVRNTLEYDEEHLLRRNAIRRILKRRLGDDKATDIAEKLIKELIWARYLPNERVRSTMILEISDIIQKYSDLFHILDEESKEGRNVYHWLLDVLSVEIEYKLGPPCIDEALASFAYQELKKRIEWKTSSISDQDKELQLYIAVHRAVLKSNVATLRFRVLTLYYPDWRTAKAGDPLMKEISTNLKKVIDSVESQITHKTQDTMYRFVRRYSIIFHLIADVGKDNPEALATAVDTKDTTAIDAAITAAATDRYNTFKSRLGRTVLRAMFFLLLTKSILAFLVEYPYELFVLQTTDYFPLVVNILFPPLLLMVIGLTVRIPRKENTEQILSAVHSIFGFGDDFNVLFKYNQPWRKGPLLVIFNAIYALVFLAVVLGIVVFLRSWHFNALSITFFIFFLSLVAYFGFRIRNTKRELTYIVKSRGFFGTFFDVLFLPIIRVGRWFSMRAPKVNIFLFFFDFIIEAPFKATIGVAETWFAFLKEKREEF